ncbi:hypothetical protein [Streptomyces sp. NRRL WC-3725]|nr:hypothetical protein [Streptomyces sp. NRRL WC-3725]
MAAGLLEQVGVRLADDVGIHEQKVLVQVDLREDVADLLGQRRPCFRV